MNRWHLAIRVGLGSNAVMIYPSTTYSTYLKTRELLDIQKRRSDDYGKPAHDEMLFIITHQTYELWFKQILTELDSILSIFGKPKLDEVDMGTAVSRLQRITEIQKLLIQQITVLETMTPLDFLDFRNMLYPASGFQSLQNRLIENKLGLKPDARINYNSAPYQNAVNDEERKELIKVEGEPSLFDHLDAWLARTPFLQIDGFDFWKHYQDAVNVLFAEDRKTVETHPYLKPEEKEKNLKEIDSSQETFRALFDEKKYEELRAAGGFRLSYKALHAALLIQLYRDQPALNLPYQLLRALQDIDELMTTWRYRHSLMAHRMLGRKIGTGGSSGATYLKTATDKHRVYNDLFNLATFLIPRSRLPELPENMRAKLGFLYTSAK